MHCLNRINKRGGAKQETGPVFTLPDLNGLNGLDRKDTDGGDGSGVR